MDTAALEIFFTTQWNAAIARHRVSLDTDDLETIKNYTSWASIQSEILQDVPQSISLIQPALQHLSVFAEFFTTKLVEDLDTAFFWGALGCLLQLITNSEDRDVEANLPVMIKQLLLQAEAFNDFCDASFDVENPIKEACFDMQLLYLDFHIHCIRYLHGGGVAAYGNESPMLLIDRRCAAAKQDLIEGIGRVKRVVQIRSSRVQSPPNTNEAVASTRIRCLMQPDSRTTRIFDRIEVFRSLDEILSHTERNTFKSVALHGMGGVGKTTVASSYLARKYDDKTYDVLLWAYGEKTVSLRQSFTDIALRLKLPGARPQNHDENLMLVQDWFQTTESKWLIVYDNVSDAATLMPYWPCSSHGRVIITTRNRSLAFEPAAEDLEILTWDARTGSDYLFFLLKKNIGRDLDAETASALALSQKLSGHALGLFHMAAIIHDGEFSIQRFMTMYAKNPYRAHGTDTLSALWDYSFRSLGKDSMNLIGVLSYLAPDGIPPDIFDTGSDRNFPVDLEFCSDEFAFSAALSKLLKLALVKKDRDTGTLSIHRMVQAQLKHFLNVDGRQRHFNNTIRLLFDVFPPEAPSQAQLYIHWKLCNRYIQHVTNVKDCFVEESRVSKTFLPSMEFCSLLSSCERFLSETNSMAELETLSAVNLGALNRLGDIPQMSDLKVSILSHQAQAAESIGHPLKAIELNQQCYDLRLQEEPRRNLLLCFASNNLAYCHNTANLHEMSATWYDKSKSYWDLAVKNGEATGDRPARHIKNHARCLVYLGKYDQARQMFEIAIPRLKSEKPLNWAMLAYALFAQATMYRRLHKFETAEAYFMEAQVIWIKGDQTRAHPFYAACLYKIGACCLDQGKVEASIKHLRDSAEIIKVHKADRPAENARCFFKLSEALLQDSMDDSHAEAVVLRDDAEKILRKADPKATRSDTEIAYDDLVPIFWR
ncbi:hypothetical protein NUW58_g7177 [Xylaria curta]|uniref:Uncharacterized protein n=1 Tax=Xylaria curta TaxID=42375 RepID=A0ACC1NJN4_9PEZI|nr:hypothetical protein NUW58_g7177 [Xylaria curta]